MRSTASPRLSKITLKGRAPPRIAERARQRHALRPARPIAKPTGCLARNSRTGSAPSTASPSTCQPPHWCSRWKRSSSGISSTQGGHQVAQKFSSSGRPRSAASATSPPLGCLEAEAPEVDRRAAAARIVAGAVPARRTGAAPSRGRRLPRPRPRPRRRMRRRFMPPPAAGAAPPGRRARRARGRRAAAPRAGRRGRGCSGTRVTGSPSAGQGDDTQQHVDVVAARAALAVRPRSRCRG